jgi:hypothetical protein
VVKTVPRTLSLLALVGDLVCVLLFALGGHSAHEASSSQVVTLRIAWPYLLACLVGWGVVRWRSWAPARVWPAGVTIWLTTYVLGMVLRAISGRGLAPGFLVVSLIFLALTMLGWRAVVQAKMHYRR